MAPCCSHPTYPIRSATKAARCLRRKQDCGAEGEEAARLNAPATRDDAQQTLEEIERTLAKLPPRVHAALLLHRSTAADTDFSARLTDVTPDGRAIQLQSGILRTRYRDPDEPRLLEPGRVYRLEIDMWATANRFKAGHRLRLDISSADFPRFDRNANRGGGPGPPFAATQTLYHNPEHASHLIISII